MCGFYGRLGLGAHTAPAVLLCLSAAAGEGREAVILTNSIAAQLSVQADTQLIGYEQTSAPFSRKKWYHLWRDNLNGLINFVVVNYFLKMWCYVEILLEKLILVELLIQFFSYIVIQSITRIIFKYLLWILDLCR